MSPRILDAERCPHCRKELPEEVPRSCPECGGSLQKRYLEAGCLSSKPVLLLGTGVAAWLARIVFGV